MGGKRMFGKLTWEFTPSPLAGTTYSQGCRVCERTVLLGNLHRQPDCLYGVSSSMWTSSLVHTFTYG